MKLFLNFAGMLVLAGLLCGGTAAAQSDEAGAAAQICYKLVDVGRSFAAGCDYQQAAAFYEEVCADAEAFRAQYPASAVQDKIDRAIGTYGDVYQLWGEAVKAREDGEDALFHDSRSYHMLDRRYPGLFAKLIAARRYGQWNGRMFYLKVDIAQEINDSFAAQYQAELSEALHLPARCRPDLRQCARP